MDEVRVMAVSELCRLARASGYDHTRWAGWGYSLIGKTVVIGPITKIERKLVSLDDIIKVIEAEERLVNRPASEILVWCDEADVADGGGADFLFFTREDAAAMAKSELH